MSTSESNLITQPGYLRKLGGLGLLHGGDEQIALAGLESLNEVEWMDLLTDAMAERQSANQVIGAWGGASYAARLSVLAGRIAPEPKRIAANACRRLLDTGVPGVEDGRVRVLDFLGAIRHSFASAVLKERMRSHDRGIREAAADSLANAQTEDAAFWCDINFGLFPETAPAAITALADLAPESGFSVLLGLKEGTVPTTELSGSVDYLIRRARETANGLAAFNHARVQAAPWISPLLGEVSGPVGKGFPRLTPDHGLAALLALVLALGLHQRTLALFAVLVTLVIATRWLIATGVNVSNRAR